MTILLPDSYIVLVGNVFVKVITHNGQIWTNIWVGRSAGFLVNSWGRVLQKTSGQIWVIFVLKPSEVYFALNQQGLEGDGGPEIT